jgi:hypothetical protein
MEATIKVSAEEFNEELFMRIKALLNQRADLQVTISINNENEALQRAIQNVENSNSLTYFSISEYEDFKKQLLNEP